MKLPSWWPWKKPEPPAAPVAVEAPRGVPTEMVEAAWREGQMYGIAEGQLLGRQQLLNEISFRLAARARPPEEYDAEDLRVDKARQLH